MSIYGQYETTLQRVMDDIEARLVAYQQKVQSETGENAYEHILARIKTDESMREKCNRKGLPETEKSALVDLTDAIGIRVICSFVDDVFNIVEYIKSFDDCEIVVEKDYITHAKPNGYRSYHIILAVHTTEEDVLGNTPGTYYVELQIRTIAMDTWAALEHKMKYKKDIPNQELLVGELKRVADELASCDLSMQTIRELINN
ncbi:ppGpp synthetase catalytic domain-containing protein (RelA/SpoT-type nucleotidyltranferase) [Lachnospiraceae bacterium NE2001]|nr:ppGpp synthetase catalytic domain-containing protein (RelA/SpoT-type nucleotidyltranferase) [Lachnospiraceae bacterium NE2001]